MKAYLTARQVLTIAHAILVDNISWEAKYDAIFSKDFQDLVRSKNIRLNYYDPDTSYEADVRAFVNALEDYFQPEQERTEA